MTTDEYKDGITRLHALRQQEITEEFFVLNNILILAWDSFSEDERSELAVFSESLVGSPQVMNPRGQPE